MKRSPVYLALLLSCFVTPLLFRSAFGVGRAQVVVSSVYWGDSQTAPISVRPGDMNIPLSIVLTNVGDDVARSVSARLDLSSPFSFEYYQEGQKKTSQSVLLSAGDIQAGTSQRLRFILSINSEASEGIYRLALALSYSSARELQEVVITQNVDVPIWRGKLYIQKITTTPEKIYPGSTGVLLRIWIVNTGQGAEQDVEARLVLDIPFKASSSGSDKVFLGIVPPNQAILAEFRIDINDLAKHGDHSIRLLSTVGKTTTVLGLISLYLNEKARFGAVNLALEQVNSGDTGVTASLPIKNIGSVAAKSVRVQLRPGNYFSGTLTDFLGTLEPGEEKTAYVTIDIDGKAPEGDHRVDLRIDWSQDDNSLYDTVTIVIKVRKKPFIVQYAPQLGLGSLVLAMILYYFVRKRKPQTK